MLKQERTKDLIEFIDISTSSYQTVLEVKRRLTQEGYKEIKMEDEWQLNPGGNYYVSPYPSCCFIFSIGSKISFNEAFRIIAAHTDQPSFRIKPSPEMSVGSYLKLNTEVYGAPILNTWLDRPLSIAGKVALKSKNVMKPIIKFIDFERPVLTIPNLAIHMNREVNKGVELNKQKDMLPLAGLLTEALSKDDFLIRRLSEKLEVRREEILDFDLFVYVKEKGEVIGFNEEFISAPRLDDLGMIHAALVSIIETNPEKGVNIVALFDNEEIGSRSKQGADTMLFNMILKRLSALYPESSSYARSITKSFMISADMAHALHPNHPEKHDPIHQPEIGKGIVIKLNANQNYVTDSESTAIFQQICERAEVPYQKFVNRSDQVGGKTLGPMTTAYVPIKVVDVGSPMLGMHSARELIGVKDHNEAIKVFKTFFELK